VANAAALLAILSRHIGAENGVGAERLAYMLDAPQRKVRQWVSELREQGHGVCAHPETGYFVAANDEELQRYYIDFLKSRALHSLRLISIATKTALPDLLGQLRLKT
jgi:biotin operon repressor